MRFDQLPLGSTVILGSKPTYPWKTDGPRSPLEWFKVAPEKLLAHTSLGSKVIGVDTEGHSTNFYPLTKMHLHLQEIESFFDDKEGQILQPFTIECAVPDAYRRSHGTKVQLNVLAALPAISELLDIDRLDYTPAAIKKEGEPFFPNNERPDSLFYMNYLTRSYAGISSFRETYGIAQFSTLRCNKIHSVRPLISVRGDAEFIYDGSGYHLIHQDVLLALDALSCLV